MGGSHPCDHSGHDIGLGSVLVPYKTSPAQSEGLQKCYLCYTYIYICLSEAKLAMHTAGPGAQTDASYGHAGRAGSVLGDRLVATTHTS